LSFSPDIHRIEARRPSSMGLWARFATPNSLMPESGRLGVWLYGRKYVRLSRSPKNYRQPQALFMALPVGESFLLMSS
jgi:hypothetical protein